MKTYMMLAVIGLMVLGCGSEDTAAPEGREGKTKQYLSVTKEIIALLKTVNDQDSAAKVEDELKRLFEQREELDRQLDTLDEGESEEEAADLKDKYMSEYKDLSKQLASELARVQGAVPGFIEKVK